jgi:hypothetical protein
MPRKKALKKSTFVKHESQSAPIEAKCTEVRRRLRRRATRPDASAGPENIFRKVLTLEKTVIRFRPADATCGRE